MWGDRDAPRIFVVIVTYNRKSLLCSCLSAIEGQSFKPSRILIVDNASTDGTQSLLAASGWLQRPEVELLALKENTGGAGGFFSGLQYALATGADWVWMMDDDAEPHPDALAELIQVADDPANIYGSLATSGEETAWVMTLLGSPSFTTSLLSDIPAKANVQMLPFLGFLIHKELVKQIGYPDPDFFIAADDAEYCVRASKAGAQIIVAGKSHIEHPKSHPYRLSIPGYTLIYLTLPPWKRYYDTRNRLLIARKHYGYRLFSQTIPGSFVRLCAALFAEPRKLAQAWAFFAGFTDGVLGLKGKRHLWWGID